MWYNVVMNLLKKKILPFFKKRVILVTHSYNFHVDDVFSTAALKILSEKRGRFVKIIRTRDEEELEFYKKKAKEKKDMFFVFDVGREYDEKNNLFDHHQKSFSLKRSEGFFYSSFGLVWKKFGKELCDGDAEIAEKIENDFVKPIDAIDVGVDIAEKKFNFKEFNFGDFNKSFYPVSQKKESFDKSFLFVMEIYRRILERKIQSQIIIKKEFLKFEEIYKKEDDKRVIFLHNHLSVGKDFENYPELLFVARKYIDGCWGVKHVLKDKGSLEGRAYFPKKWGGLQNTEFEKASGIKDVSFCHSGLWFVKTKNFESCRQVVKSTLENLKS